MRKFFRPLALLAILGIVGAACGNNNEGPGGTSAPAQTSGGAAASPTGEPVKIGLVYDTTGRGDKSFNDSAAAGLDKAKGEFNLDAKELTPNSGGTNRADLLSLLATQGYGLIIGVGFLFAPTMGAAAHQFKDVDFADVDGFIDGVQHCGKGTKVDHSYISQPPDFTGFDDPAKAKTIAQGMYQGGADVVYHAAGGSGAGLFAAAEEFSQENNTHVWAIGTDSDQYLSAPPDQQPFILTSNLKRVDVAVYDTIKDYVNGNFTGGIKTFDLKSDGVGYATSGGFVDDIKSKLDELAGNIKAGIIKVPTTLGG